MSETLLDAAELEAIQAAIRETTPRRRADVPNPEATRVALIAGDREAEAARPVLLALVNRWLRGLTRTLRAYLPGEWRVDAASADVIDGRSAREELRPTWTAALGGTDPAAVAVLSIRGPVVELAAARRCGEDRAHADTGRTTTALAHKLFEPAGRAVVQDLAATWTEATGIAVKPGPQSEPALARIAEAGAVVRAAVAMSGDVTGQLVLYTLPGALLQRPDAIAAIAADRAVIAAALGGVPVELRVELGRIQLRLGQLRRMQPGETFTLPSFVDTPVPLYCGDVIKAYGRPVVSRGVLAIEVTAVVAATRGKR